MDSEKQREIASKGGKAAHQKGTAHQFTTEEARAAGRKGGQAAHSKGTAHKFTSEEARAAGRKGGRSVRNNPEMTPETTDATPAPLKEDVQEAPTTNGNGGSQTPNQEPPTNGPYTAPETPPVQSFTPSGRPV
jgi:general stress protein YciG